VADAQASGDSEPPALDSFERDTAVALRERDGARHVFDATVSGEWRAGRGPHGGYLAAMLLRALLAAVDDPQRAPRSMTIHYARAPEAGPVSITTTLERQGRSLSTLSARMEQEGKLMALVLSAFSVPWTAPEISEVRLPDAQPPDEPRESPASLRRFAPQFSKHLVIQPRIGPIPFRGSNEPMAVGAWLGLRDPDRPLDALALALFSDSLYSPPFIKLDGPGTSPTIDLTIHFRAHIGEGVPGTIAHNLCFARFHTTLVHEGFFEEDGVIWAPDGTLLVQSRQLAILMPLSER
jgi:acyl-CoA thioesterase